MPTLNESLKRLWPGPKCSPVQRKHRKTSGIQQECLPSGETEPSLVAYVISNIISWAVSNNDDTKECTNMWVGDALRATEDGERCRGIAETSPVVTWRPSTLKELIWEILIRCVMSSDILIIPTTHHYAYFSQFDWLDKKVLHFDKLQEQESRNLFPSASS